MNTDDDPLAFQCPRCGLRMAVTRIHDSVDIFHRKPTCAAFNARDPEYASEVYALDAAQRAKL